jgi:YjjI family glycine radical enzyme
MVLDILKDSSLTYPQKVVQLARYAENSIEPITRSEELVSWMSAGVISDMFEGNAPYRPRYIVPNYELLMEKGCTFLDLEAPKSLMDALNTLMIFYHHVPSITTLPVYIGELDVLLSPFVQEDTEEVESQLRWFLKHIDRTITDSFCHANLSGHDNIVTRIILRLERELEHAIPNITLKVHEQTTDALMEEAVKTAIKVAKPSFANHGMFSKDFGFKPYGIVSCYNGLQIGGGSYTLVRMNLGKLAALGTSMASFFENLDKAVADMLYYMDQRVDFLLDQTDFFESHFLVKEGFIALENFTAMFGIVGVADAVNQLMGDHQYGNNSEADALGLSIVKTIETLVNQHGHPKLYATNGQYVLHAQVGLDTDEGVSPGCRIPIGDEPDLAHHLLQSAPFHAYFPSGIGDIFRFEETIKGNLSAAVQIIRGAFNSGLRYFSLYEDSADVVRITGYLVKKSDIEKLKRGEQVINDAVVLGKGAVENQHVLDRQLRKDL